MKAKGLRKFIIYITFGTLFTLFSFKPVFAVDASNVASIIYESGSWQVVEIPGRSKILYRVATNSINVKDTHLSIDLVSNCQPNPAIMIKKFQKYSRELNGGMLILQYKVPNLFEDQEVVSTEMSEGDTYAFFKFKNLSVEKIFNSKESSRLAIWVPESGDGRVKRSSNFYFSLEGFKNAFAKATEMCKANN
jgi:hypothetical protein